MEHWFDRLAQRHTRRTTLKAAALAGAAMLLPTGDWGSRASAAEAEPCLKTCLTAAERQLLQAEKTCDRIFGLSFGGLLAGPVPGAVSVLLGSENASKCFGTTEIQWYKQQLACHDPECGNPTKYPGGRLPTAPVPPELADCVKSGGVICGNICCNATGAPECCICPKSGAYQCCAHGSCDCVRNC